VIDPLAAAVWSHWNPVRISGGAGSIESLADLVPKARSALLVTTPGFTRRGLTARVQQLLGSARVSVYDAVSPNPQLDALDAATSRFAGEDFGAIVAIGGGSALDSAKVLGVTLRSGLPAPLAGILREGKAHVWTDAIPVIAVPTTSGTGAEVTPFATVWDGETHRKHSVAGVMVHPSHAVLDPLLTVSLPADETLYSGLDAISHALESLWNRNRTPVSTLFSVEALALASTALPAVLRDPSDVAARAAMQQASLLSGLAISQTRTAIAHSISYPLTIRFNVPHGLACSFTLGELLRLNAGDLAGGVRERSVFLAVAELLSSLELGARVRRYASAEQILAFESEMQTVDRLGNYSGRAAAVRDLLETSLA
jgi:phosphonate metabolism-associated iron-containing alcohol dehydrogenase